MTPPERAKFSQQAINKIAEVAIASQLKQVDKLKVQIETELSKLARGQIDSLNINMNNLLMQPYLIVEELQLKINSVTVKPRSAILGKIKLVHPSTGAILAETFEQLGKLSDLEPLRYSVEFCQLIANIVCQDAPRAIAAAGIEALLVDQLEPAGETVAEFLQLPFICVSSALAIHRTADIPPFFTPWNYHNTKLKQAISEAGGVKRAADIVEQAVTARCTQPQLMLK